MFFSKGKTHNIFSILGIKFKFKRKFKIQYYSDRKNNTVVIDGVECFPLAENTNMPEGLVINIYGENNTIKIGKNLNCGPCEINIGLKNMMYVNDCIIEIGDNCDLKKYKSFMYGSDNKLHIGNNVTINEGFLIQNCTDVNIGNNSLISWDFEIISYDGHRIYDKKTKKQLNPFGEKIEIGEHVWIGSGVKILKGSKIAKDCVVGANSLITKKFEEPNCIIAGSPAKVIKKDIYWEE